MLTDCYCKLKERKRVAAIYDSYPLYSDPDHKFEEKAVDRALGDKNLDLKL